MNFKRFLVIIFAVVITILVPMNPAVLAQLDPANSTKSNTQNNGRTQVIDLGKQLDPKSGKEVQGLKIVHQVKSQATVYAESVDVPQFLTQPLSTQPIQAINSTGCYGFVAPLTKWKNAEPWVMNATNSRGLDQSTVFNLEKNNISKWEDSADGSFDGLVSKDIIGEGTLSAQTLTGGLNGTNEVYFADVDIPGAVAATTIWYFGNATRPQDREIVEWDQVFDDHDFDFSTNGDVQKMDFENVSTHETGLTFGLTDISNDSCGQTTMYNLTAAGELSKSTLEAQDVTGIWQLYIDPLTDSDTDGFADYKEQYVGTNPFIACGTNAWPVDFNSDKRVNSGDQLSVALHYGPFGSSKYAARQDVDANGTVDSGDQLKVALEFGKRCTI